MVVQAFSMQNKKEVLGKMTPEAKREMKITAVFLCLIMATAGAFTYLFPLGLRQVKDGVAYLLNNESVQPMVEAQINTGTIKPHYAVGDEGVIEVTDPYVVPGMAMRASITVRNAGDQYGFPYNQITLRPGLYVLYIGVDVVPSKRTVELVNYMIQRGYLNVDNLVSMLNPARKVSKDTYERFDPKNETCVVECGCSFIDETGEYTCSPRDKANCQKCLLHAVSFMRYWEETGRLSTETDFKKLTPSEALLLMDMIGHKDHLKYKRITSGIESGGCNWEVVYPYREATFKEKASSLVCSLVTLVKDDAKCVPYSEFKELLAKSNEEISKVWIYRWNCIKLMWADLYDDVYVEMRRDACKGVEDTDKCFATLDEMIENGSIRRYIAMHGIYGAGTGFGEKTFNPVGGSSVIACALTDDTAGEINTYGMFGKDMRICGIGGEGLKPGDKASFEFYVLVPADAPSGALPEDLVEQLGGSKEYVEIKSVWSSCRDVSARGINAGNCHEIMAMIAPARHDRYPFKGTFSCAKDSFSINPFKFFSNFRLCMENMQTFEKTGPPIAVASGVFFVIAPKIRFSMTFLMWGMFAAGVAAGGTRGYRKAVVGR